MSEQIPAKVIKWAKETNNLKFKKSPKLLMALYAENNKAKKIKDMLDGMDVDMKVIVANIKTRQIRLCQKCWNKVCKDSCGHEDYASCDSYSIKVGDEYGGMTTLNIPPWYQGEVPESNHAYRVQGTAKLVQGTDNTLEINPVSKIEEIELEEIEMHDSEDESEEDGEAPVKKKQVEEDEEEESAPKKKVKEESDEEEETEEEKPVKKVKKVADEDEEAPKKKASNISDKILDRVRNYFRASDGVRTPKQFRSYLEAQAWEDKEKEIIEALGLTRNDEKELEYVDE